MRTDDPQAWAHEAWNRNAAFWDARMGEGNSFFELLVWPATERLLGLHAGEQVLDVACGNGLTSRRLAAAGARVVAFDALGADRFDAALCNMALFDMAEIRPLMRALGRLLRPGGRFVFSVLHPCFNGCRTVQMAEQEDRGGQIVTTYSVKVHGYLTPTVSAGLAMVGQPSPQPYFDRPLQVLLGACFEAGFVLDGLEERAFPPDTPAGSTPLSWSGHFSEIPPVLVARVRLAGPGSATGQP